MSEPEGKRVYEARTENSTGHVFALGAGRTAAEAEAVLGEARERHGSTYARYWIEEIGTTDLFQLPSRPKPRDRYTTRVTEARTPGAWPKCNVEVLEGESVIAEYDRNYGMLQTFEPFRQGDRMFALISPHYTATSVMDLHTGEIVASEEPSGGGFCPAGFYVPDWWDVHHGRTLPGTLYWDPVDHEWPADGDFGFVWGCVWGDDSSWKVQYLDLSSVRDGVIRREERFGYLRLADLEIAPQRFIRCSSWQGDRRVEFYTSRGFDLVSGTTILDGDL